MGREEEIAEALRFLDDFRADMGVEINVSAHAEKKCAGWEAVVVQLGTRLLALQRSDAEAEKIVVVCCPDHLAIARDFFVVRGGRYTEALHLANEIRDWMEEQKRGGGPAGAGEDG